MGNGLGAVVGVAVRIIPVLHSKANAVSIEQAGHGTPRLLRKLHECSTWAVEDKLSGCLYADSFMHLFCEREIH